ncbi:hypothetical protein [Oscillatoria sp. HE19RPO]|uniref:hypothetical protein n=1 Tax=Oscillatoria sp. HE19RPO TaxID=2954806 RepID=UPI0020C4B9B3|nr:hypothetical protein [Oscillatoria sp. HE19RPO]
MINSDLKKYLWLVYVESLEFAGTWLQEYVNAKYAKVLRELNLSAKAPENASNVMNFSLMFKKKKINNGFALL